MTWPMAMEKQGWCRGFSHMEGYLKSTICSC